MDVRELYPGMVVCVRIDDMSAPRHVGKHIAKGRVKGLGAGRGARHQVELLTWRPGKVEEFTSRAVLGKWSKELEDYIAPVEARRVEAFKEATQREAQLQLAHANADELANKLTMMASVDEHTYIIADRSYGRRQEFYIRMSVDAAERLFELALPTWRTAIGYDDE